MISYKKALQILKKGRIEFKSEIILSKNSVNRISTNNLNSPNNYPSANNTAFDGFAINSKETNSINKNNIIKFRILKILAAGDNPLIKKIPKYSAIEVMTGAVIQKPFDTIIPIEKVKYFPNKNNPKYILIDRKIKKNNFIRFAGSDYKRGERVINKGQKIQPGHILAFKTLGIEKIKVKQKPKIVFYTTGNEISNKKNIPNWKVRNSNGHYLKSFLKNFSVDFKERKILRDHDEIKFRKEIIHHLKSKTNIVITSGAISAGKFDFVPKVLSKFKLKKSFKGVSIRPGKPIMFAKFNKNLIFFGLPGNPISSAACFRFFVLPFLYLSLGVNSEKTVTARIKNNFVKKKNFTRFIKGRLYISKKGLAEFLVLKGQESFRINPFSKSNAWGIFPSGKSVFKIGDCVECYTSSGINEFS